MRGKPTARAFEAFFIRYGVNTYNCMRYVSLTPYATHISHTGE